MTDTLPMTDEELAKAMADFVAAAERASTTGAVRTGDDRPEVEPRYGDSANLNIFGNEYLEDRAGSWDEARTACPVAHTTEFDKTGWIPLTWQTIADIVADTDTFSSTQIGVAPRTPDAPDLAAPPITSDPPFHTDARRLLLPFFSNQAMAPMSDITREIVFERLDAIAAQLAERQGTADEGITDAADMFAKYIPVRLISHILGLPKSDEMQFSDWAMGVLQTDIAEVDARMEASVGLTKYFIDLVEQRREQPTEDLPSKMIDMTLPDGSPLETVHIVGACFLLIVAGIDTTQTTIGSMLYHLATNPADRQRLVDEPELIPTAIEEFLRAYAPVTMARITTEDTEIAGCPVAQGERVYLPFGAANRDPEKFERPDEVLIDRAENRHGAFGLGIHRCLGSNLARIELEVALQEWLKRYPDFELATEREHDGVLWRGVQVAGPRHLYLRIAG